MVVTLSLFRRSKATAHRIAVSRTCAETRIVYPLCVYSELSNSRGVTSATRTNEPGFLPDFASFLGVLWGMCSNNWGVILVGEGLGERGWPLKQLYSHSHDAAASYGIERRQ